MAARRLHAENAERALLGAVILGGDAVLDRAAVEPADLFNLKHVAIWEAMLNLRAIGKPSGDVQLLEEQLRAKLDSIGGLSYLAELTEATNPDNVEEYSALVRRSALTRRVQETLARLSASSLEGPELLAEVLHKTRELSRGIEDGATRMDAAMRQTLAEIGELMASTDTKGGLGVATGFDRLDALLGGVQRGVVTLVAGRPSMGKSALVRKFCEHATMTSGLGAHVFSMDDSLRSAAIREMSDLARVDLDRFSTLKLLPHDLQAISAAVHRMDEAKAPWLVDDATGLSALDVATRVRKRLVDNRTNLVVIDFIQLLHEPDLPMRDPRLQINTSMKRLHDLARSEDVAVVVVSQLSRACETEGKDKRPELRHLKESGNLEEDAYAVLMVYRDDYYNSESEDEGICEVIVRKNKNGPVGTVKTSWHAQTATHRPLSQREDGG